MEKITYKRATIDDSKVLYDLSVEFEKFNKDHSTRPHEHFIGDWEVYIPQDLEKVLKEKDSFVYIAFVDGSPAGYVYARLWEEHFAFMVEELFVKSEYSKLGIGNALMDRVIKHGHEYNRDVKVEVFDWNTPALEYYLKRGFFLESVVLKLSKSTSK